MDSQAGAGDESVEEVGGGTATVVAEPKPKAKRKKREVPRYHVILWDSNQHTYEYVEKMLRELFGHTKEQCRKLAEEVDTKGKVIVLTTTKEHGELKRDQIIAYGKDERMKGCKGSMHATIEAAP